MNFYIPLGVMVIVCDRNTGDESSTLQLVKL